MIEFAAPIIVRIRWLNDSWFVRDWRVHAAEISDLGPMTSIDTKVLRDLLVGRVVLDFHDRRRQIVGIETFATPTQRVGAKIGVAFTLEDPDV